MIINVKHCFVPIELPDNPTAADVNEAIAKYQGSFDYYRHPSQFNSYNEDVLRIKYDTIGYVCDEIWEAIKEVRE